MKQPHNKYINVWLILLFLVLNSCSQKNTAPQPTVSEPKKTSVGNSSQTEVVQSQTQVPNTSASSSWVFGKIMIINSAGMPLENMAGIATEKPNAFDEPIARGNLSGPDGISTIQIPKNKGVFIRAWDPILHYFPNNYFEIPPTDADSLEDMQVLMLEASIIELQLFDKDDQPVKNENVGLMMFHPKLGPWWPCDGHTDEAGNIHFKPIPAGMYNLRLKTERGMILEIKEIKIPPASTIDLGKIKPN
ncbi:MAG: hypothetical protein ACP5KS_10095 [Candidatus Hydrogenedens sp.]